MKYLKIEDNKGKFRTGASGEEWKDIDRMTKEDLISILEFAESDEFEMDEYDEELLKNPAHNIIYKNIHGKLSDFVSKRSQFNDRVANLYSSALDKYSIEEE